MLLPAMENKHVGWLVIGIAFAIIGIIFLFNTAMKEIVAEGCPLQFHDGAVCPAYKTIDQQTYLSLSIVGVLIVLGIVIIVSKPKRQVIVRRIGEKRAKLNIEGDLTRDERQIITILSKSGPAFQAELIEKANIGKAKMTRILDRLENRGFVERKRRGLTNIVILK